MALMISSRCWNTTFKPKQEFLSGFLVTTAGDAMDQAALQFDVWDTDGNGVLTKEVS